MTTKDNELPVPLENAWSFWMANNDGPVGQTVEQYNACLKNYYTFSTIQVRSFPT